MSEQQWYCPNCGPEISVTVERIHTFSGPDDYIVCTGCGETVDEKAETPAFVLALQQRIDEQREKVATWIMSLGLSTGHGDTLEDLLKEAHWQVREYQQRIATLEAAISEMTTDPCGEYYTGLRCGVEDRDIVCRYEAAEYGWQQAFEYIGSIAAGYPVEG